MEKSVAIVTGASSGIGRAAAIRLAQDFDVVILAAQNTDQLAVAALEVRQAGAEAYVAQGDLGQASTAADIVKTALDRYGRIDALVNIAGAVPGLDVFDMSDEQWDQGMALKFHGARRLTLQAWEALKESRGSVVFISGTAAENPKAAQAAVAAINAAVEALAKAFSERGVADGVQVNTVSPGAVMTGRRLGMLEKAAKAREITLNEMKAQFLRTAGIARFGEAAEIAELIAFLLSPSARWLTGSVVRMDGGEIKST